MGRKRNPERPFVYLNVAMTADGKIAPANRHFVPFTSRHDRDLLLKLRSEADAVMSGARTVDAGPVTLGPGGIRYRRRRKKLGLQEYNLRVIVSGSGSILPSAEIFRHRFSPIIALVTARAGKRIGTLRKLGANVEICGEEQIDFQRALVLLRKKWKVKRLLCEGGGGVNAALLRAGLVDELYLTIAPIILGGRDAPTLAEGDGIERLSEAVNLVLISKRRRGDELYLRYRVTPKRRASRRKGSSPPPP